VAISLCDKLAPKHHSLWYFPIKTYHSEILKWPRLLNILQCLLQILQFHINSALRLLGILDGLLFKRLDSLDLPSHIICLVFEVLKVVLDLADYGLVLEDLTVVGKVDFLRLLREHRHPTSGIFIALLEGLEGGYGLTTEAKVVGDCLPIELESCTSLLEWNVSLIRAVLVRIAGKDIGPIGDVQKL
jgi:hypothetical protein